MKIKSKGFHNTNRGSRSQIQQQNWTKTQILSQTDQENLVEKTTVANLNLHN